MSQNLDQDGEYDGGRTQVVDTGGIRKALDQKEEETDEFKAVNIALTQTLRLISPSISIKQINQKSFPKLTGDIDLIVSDMTAKPSAYSGNNSLLRGLAMVCIKLQQSPDEAIHHKEIELRNVIHNFTSHKTPEVES